MNLARLLERAATTWGERPAIAVGAGPRLDYRALAAQVARLAGALRGPLGLKAGDNVALVLKNCAEYYPLLFACWHAGLAAVPINAKLHAREVAWILDDAKASALFVSEELAHDLLSLNPGSADLKARVVIGAHQCNFEKERDSVRIRSVARTADCALFPNLTKSAASALRALQPPDEARRVPPSAAHRLNVGVELIDQRGDRERCAARARFGESDPQILAHPVDGEAEVELVGRHGARAVLHLPGARRAAGNCVKRAFDVETRLRGEMNALGETLQEPGDADLVHRLA